jgi:hypothetical protein
MALRISSVAILSVGLLASGQVVWAQTTCRGESGGIGICGNVSGSTITTGIPPEQLERLVATRTQELTERTEEQKKLIDRFAKDLDLNERQISTALEIVGEKNIPPERLADKLVEVAQRFKALQEQIASTQPGDDAQIIALKADAGKAIDAGDLSKADALLAKIEAQQRQALERLAINAAETIARRGDIALTRLQYGEAAKHFANAAAVFPPESANEEKRVKYLPKGGRRALSAGGRIRRQWSLGRRY